ncbi:lipid-A-disaccharide synthase [Dokdonella immobilis]|uniref:Lipid-A-disaccharide synthase n=1 Tax=Dokdonella immobilis TaxID=578942 RepID=A0A1I4ZEY5_9GAMM|nr:lipid-A-disaccharide synthase [Dokdonella immobilis]SFN48593.1 lipid-A-disaccharide synthase [Dokdonella immobilis]
MTESRIPNPESRLFVLVAGEVSGDLLGARLIEGLRERFPDARFAGIGGPNMVAAGFEAWFPAERLAVMGLAEVLRHLPGLLRIRREVRQRTLALRPDAFIGIDAPDFNLALERSLKHAGIRTIHYVSPSIWAWREKRAERIGESADRVLCLFPMEPPVYARHGVDARFVGHPLADAFALDPDQAAARAALGLASDGPVLAMLPGSRLGEIARLGADFIGAARILSAQIPNLQVVVPMANEACRAAFASLLAKAGLGIGDSGFGQDAAESATTGRHSESPIPNPQSRPSILVVDGQSHTAMIAADAILLASGTAALEAMLAKRPMVVAYRIARLTYWIVKGLGLLKVDRYSLPNHLAGRDLVPELMQDDCTPEALAAALRGPLLERHIDGALLAEYRRLHELLRGDADHNAAAAVIDA